MSSDARRLRRFGGVLSRPRRAARPAAGGTGRASRRDPEAWKDEPLEKDPDDEESPEPPGVAHPRIRGLEDAEAANTMNYSISIKL